MCRDELRAQPREGAIHLERLARGCRAATAAARLGLVGTQAQGGIGGIGGSRAVAAGLGTAKVCMQAVLQIDA